MYTRKDFFVLGYADEFVLYFKHIYNVFKN